MYLSNPSGSLSQEEMVLFLVVAANVTWHSCLGQLGRIAWRYKSTGTHAQGKDYWQSTDQHFNLSKVPSITLDERPLPQETSHLPHEQNTHYSMSLSDSFTRLW